MECHKETSFYTWDGLTGINTDLIFFFVNIVFYCCLVVALELGYINRIKVKYGEWRRNKLVKKGKISNDDILTDMALLDEVL